MMLDHQNYKMVVVVKWSHSKKKMAYLKILFVVDSTRELFLGKTFTDNLLEIS